MGQWSYQSYFTNFFLINIGHHLISFNNLMITIPKSTKTTFRAWGEVLPRLKLFTFFNYCIKVFPQLSCNSTDSFDRNYGEGKAIAFLPVKILCNKINISFKWWWRRDYIICIFLYFIFIFFLEKKQIIKFCWGLVTNTRVYNLSSGPCITHFLAVVAKKWKNLE